MKNRSRAHHTRLFTLSLKTKQKLQQNPFAAKLGICTRDSKNLLQKRTHDFISSLVIKRRGEQRIQASSLGEEKYIFSDSLKPTNQSEIDRHQV